MRFFLLFLLLFSTAACRRTDPTPAPLPISDNKLKIEVAEDGLYAIDLAAVQALGVQLENWSAAPLALTHNGQPIAHLLHEGQLLFYGRANDSIYTTTRAYLLEIGTEGVAMNTSAVSPPPAASPSSPVLSQLHLEQNTLYVSNAHTAEYPDTWYWHTIHVEQMFETTFTLPESVAKGDGSGRLRLQFWGASHDPNVQDDHDLDVSLNGQFIQKIVWEGQVHHTAELDIPAGLLRAGENTLLLDNRPVGNTFIDISHLDWIEVNYQTAAEADNDALAFTTSGGAISLAGFSAPPSFSASPIPTSPRWWGWPRPPLTPRPTPPIWPSPPLATASPPN
ncbi:MAG: hypothetical protein IPL28_08310 [Chloroflexi bacterium]|nr:hypothetical protein [Chloroflexota bacterium]